MYIHSVVVWLWSLPFFTENLHPPTPIFPSFPTYLSHFLHCSQIWGRWGFRWCRWWERWLGHSRISQCEHPVCPEVEIQRRQSAQEIWPRSGESASQYRAEGPKSSYCHAPSQILPSHKNVIWKETVEQRRVEVVCMGWNSSDSCYHPDDCSTDCLVSHIWQELQAPPICAIVYICWFFPFCCLWNCFLSRHDNLYRSLACCTNQFCHFFTVNALCLCIIIHEIIVIIKLWNKKSLLKQRKELQEGEKSILRRLLRSSLQPLHHRFDCRQNFLFLSWLDSWGSIACMPR